MAFGNRRYPEDISPDTDVIVLHRLPQNTDEVANLLGAIDTEGPLDTHWGKRHTISRENIVAGNWSAVQWYDGCLEKAIKKLNALPHLIEIGGGSAADRLRAPSGKDMWTAFPLVRHPEESSTPSK